ncbi:hypothetical protein VTN77DRAFT_8676 [Rasamsonia byssochlamydoides]|uniref:uncharacterized protein n=1 Tax=Rasamsonia byssochlamydoides TaxID=89139 RepID=UPI003742488D
MAPSGHFGVFALPTATARHKDTESPWVDENGRPIRRRRRHVKSRKGCVTCKERRVKCDEHHPICYNCSRRNLSCRFDDDTPRQRIPRDPREAPFLHPEDRSGNSASGCLSEGSRDQSLILAGLQAHDINLKARMLMHHFENHTAKTLLFGAELWQHRVLPLALQVGGEGGYLMHAVLLMAASHLHHLHPESAEYTHAEAYHLAHTLSGFRRALSRPFQEQNADVIVACAFILLHYAWAVPFSAELSPDADGVIDIGTDNLLSFAAGLKSVIVTTRDVDRNSLRIFKELLRPNSIQRFKDWAASAGSSYDFEGHFLHRPRIDPASLNHADSDRECFGLSCGSVDAVDRLIPVFYTIDAVSRGEDMAHLMSEVKAYLLMWPGKCTKEFEQAVRENRNEALVVLLCFYASTCWLMAKDVWWVQERSKFMCDAISKRLESKRDSWDDRVFKICEYFKIKQQHR